MRDIAEAAQPITGRASATNFSTPDYSPINGTGGYASGTIDLLKEAREENIIPWEWIVDDSRERER